MLLLIGNLVDFYYFCILKKESLFRMILNNAKYNF